MVYMPVPWSPMGDIKEGSESRGNAVKVQCLEFRVLTVARPFVETPKLSGEILPLARQFCRAAFSESRFWMR